jgi:GWxTD domain-containing protein
MRFLRLLSWYSLCAVLLALLVMSSSGQQTTTQTQSAQPPAPTGAKKETVAKPMTDRQKKKQEEKLRKELETPYKKWLNEDVVYIITEDEKKTFTHLQTDEERENFIESFWLRRDPTPDTEENEYREEHYRRIAYANEHFASGIPGWKTDRGRIYIEYGPADEVESHPSGGTYERPFEEGGGTTSTYPFEQWRYRYIEGLGTNIILEFVDTTMSGEYHFTIDPSEKDALLYVPNAGLTLSEQMGLTCKTCRFTRTDGTHLGVGSQPLPDSMSEFNRIELGAKIFAPPAIKYKDLEALTYSTIKYNLLPMKVHADYIPVTGSSVLTNITIQFDRKDLQFKQKEGISTAIVNVYGRITTMSRKPVNYFEEDLEVPVPTEMLQQAMAGPDGQPRADIYQKVFPLKPGRYRLNISAKDRVGGNTTVYEMPLEVPRIEEDVLGSSSLILADLIEPVDTRSIGTGQFVIGGYKVRPRMGNTFKRSEKLNFYMQLYNFGVDETTKKPSGTVEMEVVKNNKAAKEVIGNDTAEVSKLPGGATQLILKKTLTLKDMDPGDYTLNIKVTDKTSNQTLTKSATFTIT